jgi:hypothetical protein
MYKIDLRGWGDSAPARPTSQRGVAARVAPFANAVFAPCAMHSLTCLGAAPCLR